MPTANQRPRPTAGLRGVPAGFAKSPTGQGKVPTGGGTLPSQPQTKGPYGQMYPGRPSGGFVPPAGGAGMGSLRDLAGGFAKSSAPKNVNLGQGLGGGGQMGFEPWIGPGQGGRAPGRWGDMPMGRGQMPGRPAGYFGGGPEGLAQRQQYQAQRAMMQRSMMEALMRLGRGRGQGGQVGIGQPGAWW